MRISLLFSIFTALFPITISQRTVFAVDKLVFEPTLQIQDDDSYPRSQILHLSGNKLYVPNERKEIFMKQAIEDTSESLHFKFENQIEPEDLEQVRSFKLVPIDIFENIISKKNHKLSKKAQKLLDIVEFDIFKTKFLIQVNGEMFLYLDTEFDDFRIGERHENSEIKLFSFSFLEEEVSCSRGRCNFITKIVPEGLAAGRGCSISVDERSNQVIFCGFRAASLNLSPIRSKQVRASESKRVQVTIGVEEPKAAASKRSRIISQPMLIVLLSLLFIIFLLLFALKLKSKEHDHTRIRLDEASAPNSPLMPNGLSPLSLSTAGQEKSYQEWLIHAGPRSPGLKQTLYGEDNCGAEPSELETKSEEAPTHQLWKKKLRSAAKVLQIKPRNKPGHKKCSNDVPTLTNFGSDANSESPWESNKSNCSSPVSRLKKYESMDIDL